jgi:hypothetical protein
MSGRGRHDSVYSGIVAITQRDGGWHGQTVACILLRASINGVQQRRNRWRQRVMLQVVGSVHVHGLRSARESIDSIPTRHE